MVKCPKDETEIRASYSRANITLVHCSGRRHEKSRDTLNSGRVGSKGNETASRKPSPRDDADKSLLLG
jgi:hypothetical protein